MAKAEILDVMSSAKLFLGLLAAVEEGVADLLYESGPLSVEQLAARTGTLPAPLRSLLRALDSAGFVAEGPDGYVLTEAGRRLSAFHPRSLNHLLRLEAWGAREHVSLPGLQAALRGRQVPTELPEPLIPVLASAVEVGGAVPALLISRRPELRGVRHLVDVGAGSGQYAVALCRAHPELRVTALDREPMLTHAGDRVARHTELRDRIQVVRWDLHTDPLPVRGDAVLVSHLLHLLDAPERLDLLARIADGLEPGGLLLVHDFLGPRLDSGVIIDWMARGACFDLDAAELIADAESCGFTPVRTERLPGAGSSLVVARRR
ncbi:methyltransferase [Dactylosporangium sp. NPDC049140]|uniref:methyltransferase n=1 Tax=Dactylosporangium sp. NPDC049140 TaxID=3155647 RepID=UPI0033C50062